MFAVHSDEPVFIPIDFVQRLVF